MTVHAGKDMEQKEHSSLLVGLQTGTTTWNHQFGGFSENSEYFFPTPSYTNSEYIPKRCSTIWQGFMFYYTDFIHDSQKLETN